MTNTACMLGNITNKMYYQKPSWHDLAWGLKLHIEIWNMVLICLTSIHIHRACRFWLLTASMTAGSIQTLSFSQKLSSGLTAANIPQCSTTVLSLSFIHTEIRTLINSLLTAVMIGVNVVFKLITCFKFWFTFKEMLMWFVMPFHWWLGSPDIHLSCVCVCLVSLYFKLQFLLLTNH